MNEMCRICAVRGVMGAGQFPYEKLGVCGDCARLIAAAYALGHSGDIPRHLYRVGDEKILGKAPSRIPTTRRKAVVPTALRWAVFKRDGYRCRSCSAHDDLTADHINPEINGGKAVLENLQTLCRSCNSKKGCRS